MHQIYTDVSIYRQCHSLIADFSVRVQFTDSDVCTNVVVYKNVQYELFHAERMRISL